MQRREQLLALTVLALLAAPFLAAAERVLEGMGADHPYDVAYVPRGSAAQFLMPGVRLSIANYYWLQTVQYIGEPKGRRRGFEKLLPLVDLVTDLDPRHGYAYQTAGIVLSSEGRLDESEQILKKGMEPGRPNWWSFPFYIAFNDYFYRGDYAEAARWAKIAARTPGASPNISHLALALDVKSGNPEDAVRFLEELRGIAKDEKTAAALEEQLKLAILQLDFSRLDAAVAAFRAQHGRPPPDLRALVAEGLLPAIPRDPFGGEYSLDSAGVVHASERDFRFKPAAPARGTTTPVPLRPPLSP
jgi:tetratricopeptide (TPR) repeat protein